MLDFKTQYDAATTKLAKFETEFLPAWGKIRATAQASPYRAPVIVLANVAGRYV